VARDLFPAGVGFQAAKLMPMGQAAMNPSHYFPSCRTPLRQSCCALVDGGAIILSLGIGVLRVILAHWDQHESMPQGLEIL
jgi:hypothetical protein